MLSGALGLLISSEKKRRTKIIEQFCQFNEQFILNLKYGREKIGKVAEGYDYVKKAMAGDEVLKGDEGKFIADYINGLGESDPATQIEYLNERGVKLKEYRQIFEDNYKKYGSMYFKLCLLAGLLIAVLLA